MGSNTSKPNNEAPGVQTLKQDFEDGDSDPRSPTPEITRTPLQGKNGVKHPITKNADLSKSFENPKGDDKLIQNNPIMSAVIQNHLQSYDPRSPTQDFERTPIIIASKIDKISNIKMLQRDKEMKSGSPSLKDAEDNDETYDSCAEAKEITELMVPKNLCNGFFDMTLSESIKESDEPLGSSTASNEALENNISHENKGKQTQLLETNFDYSETNQDMQNNDDNVDPVATVTNITPMSDLRNVPLFKLLTDDPRSPSAGIDRTPIVVAKTADDESEGNVEEMSDDTLIKLLQNTNTDLRQSVVKTTNEEVLIYEDESNNLVDTPVKSKPDSNSGNRTPLSCMKNKTDVGYIRSKSVNTLDGPQDHKAKVPRRVSHIPRLKSLSKQTKFHPSGSSISLKNISKKPIDDSGDCENTPPHSHRDKWDKDHSIVL